MVYIYILKLDRDKYYIGKTENPDIRLTSHYNSMGSKWTQKYKPIKIHQIIPNCDNYDEDKYTLQYMEKYGINNVRGGSFCNIDLNIQTKEHILKMINSSNNKCLKCGDIGHFSSKCKIKNTTTPKQKRVGVFKNSLSCSRCGRKNHKYDKCYASTDINGFSVESNNSSNEEYDEIYYCSFCGKEFDTKQGASFHEIRYCKMKNATKTTNKNTGYTKKKTNGCYRCGRQGHYSDNCYASTHIKGYDIY